MDNNWEKNRDTRHPEWERNPELYREQHPDYYQARYPEHSPEWYRERYAEHHPAAYRAPHPDVHPNWVGERNPEMYRERYAERSPEWYRERYPEPRRLPPPRDYFYGPESWWWKVLLGLLLLSLLGTMFYNATRRTRLTTDDLSGVRVGDLSYLERIAGDDRLPNPALEDVYILFWKVSDPVSTREIRNWMEAHRVEYAENPGRFIVVAYSPRVDFHGIGLSNSVTGITDQIPLQRNVQDALMNGELPFRTVWADRSGHLTSLINDEIRRRKQWILRPGEYPFPPILHVRQGRVYPEYLDSYYNANTARTGFTAGERINPVNHGVINSVENGVRNNLGITSGNNMGNSAGVGVRNNAGTSTGNALGVGVRPNAGNNVGNAVRSNGVGNAGAPVNNNTVEEIIIPVPVPVEEIIIPEPGNSGGKLL